MAANDQCKRCGGPAYRQVALYGDEIPGAAVYDSQECDCLTDDEFADLAYQYADLENDERKLEAA